MLIAGAVALTTALTSCNKSDADREIKGNRTTFTLSAPDPKTRADEPTAIKRYVMEVWSEDALTAENVFEDGATQRAESTTGTFAVALDPEKAYTCLFWADDNGQTYDAASLQTIAIKEGKEVSEAYHAKISVAKGERTDVSITLKRAVAKIELEETAELEQGKTLAATYKQLPQFDVMKGKAIGKAEDKTYTMSVAADKLSGVVAQFFMLATAESLITDFAFVYHGQAAKAVTNVPVQQNYTTKIKGSYATLLEDDYSFTVTTDQTWNTPDKEISFDAKIVISDTPGANGAPVYEISNAKGFKAFVDLINGAGEAYEVNGIEIPAESTEDQRKSNIVLKEDIDFSELYGADKGDWQPIGTGGDKAFTGTFDGGGKTISNFNVVEQLDQTGDVTQYGKDVFQGLIGYCENAMIKDLTIDGDITIDNKGYLHNIVVGGVVAVAYNSTIINCHSSVKIDIKQSNQSGEGGGGLTAGGVVGGSTYSSIKGSSSSSVISCEFVAPESEYMLIARVGGVAGSVSASGHISDCHYSGGSVYAYSKNHECAVGGVVGMISNSEIFGCVNNSPVSGKTERWNLHIGGICGYMSYKGKMGASYNTADVTVLDGTKNYAVGGGVGRGHTSNILSCYSNGIVIDKTTTGVDDAYKGGLIGYLSDYSAQQSWYLASADLGTNGIGETSDDSTVVDCGRVADVAALNAKVDAMNAAIKTYNDAALDDKNKCNFHYVAGSSAVPTLAAGAPN